MCSIKCDQLLSLIGVEATISALGLIGTLSVSLIATGSLVSAIGIGTLFAAPFIASTLAGTGAFLLFYYDIVPLHYAHFISAAAGILFVTAVVIFCVAIQFLSLPFACCFGICAGITIAHQITKGLEIQKLNAAIIKLNNTSRHGAQVMDAHTDVKEENKIVFGELNKICDELEKEIDRKILTLKQRRLTLNGPELLEENSKQLDELNASKRALCEARESCQEQARHNEAITTTHPILGKQWDLTKVLSNPRSLAIPAPL